MNIYQLKLSFLVPGQKQRRNKKKENSELNYLTVTFERIQVSDFSRKKLIKSKKKKKRKRHFFSLSVGRI